MDWGLVARLLAVRRLTFLLGHLDVWLPEVTAEWGQRRRVRQRTGHAVALSKFRLRNSKASQWSDL